jgi:hypothetical protein
VTDPAPPIWKRCEGSDYQPATPTTLTRCPMCGTHPIGDDGTVPPHNRRDIIAELNRGDFNAR